MLTIEDIENLEERDLIHTPECVNCPACLFEEQVTEACGDLEDAFYEAMFHEDWEEMKRILEMEKELKDTNR
jgi:hypothetical protein